MDLEKTKEKNLLDHEFQKSLNYLNIIAITALTSIFAVYPALITKQLEINSFWTIVILILIISFPLILIFKTKMDGVNKKIKEL